MHSSPPLHGLQLADCFGPGCPVSMRYGLWKKHEALPEVFDTRAESPTQARQGSFGDWAHCALFSIVQMGRDSPLRPELIEAIFYLSLALPGDSMIFDMEPWLVELCRSRQTCFWGSNLWTRQRISPQPSTTRAESTAALLPWQM